MSNDGLTQSYSIEVLSGLHRGVKQDLPPGDYQVGSGIRSDLVFSDGAVADRHCLLKLGEKSAKLLPQAGSVRVNGKNVEEETEVGGPICYVELGTVTLAIEVEQAAPRNIKERFSRSFSFSKSVKRETAVNLDDDLPALDAGYASPRQKGFRKAGAVAMFGTAALVIMLILSGGLRSPEPPKDVTVQIRDLLERYDIKKSKVASQNNFRNWVVRIYDPIDESARQQIKAAIGSEFEGVEIRIITAEMIREQVDRLLGNYGDAVEVGLVNSGAVHLRGRVDTLEAYERLTKSIANDVPDVAQVNTNSLVVVADASNYLRQRLLENGLEDLPEIRVEGGQLQFDVPESWLEKNQWHDTIAEFRGRYLPYLDVVTGVKGAEGPVLPKLTLQGIFYGEQPYILMNDGEPYFPGTVVSGGWTIAEISSTGVILERRGERVELN